MAKNYYQILGLDYNCNFMQIKKAYYRRAKECHPDRFSGSRAKEEEFKVVVEAFDALSDPVKRSNFDKKLDIVHEKGTVTPVHYDEDAIMDTFADDTLEELFVGNKPPPNTHLSTLFVDLAKTEVFITFREGKDHFLNRRFRAAKGDFLRAVAIAPNNILYRYYLGKTYTALREYPKAKLHYKAALAIGEKRLPVQRLEKVHKELEYVYTKHLPLWNKMVNFFFEKKDNRLVSPPDEVMIAETNRAIAKLMNEQERIKEKKRKQLNE